jgi:hypothetical protein
MRMFSTRPILAKLAVGGALFAAVGGVAYAASGGPFVGGDGSITGCAQPNGGQVHIWKPGHHCSGGWLSVAFASSGAAGPAGAVGPTGPTGPVGPSNPAATTVDGQTVSKLLLKVPTPSSGTPTATLYSADGLTILAACDSSGNASLQANGPASADSELTVNGYGNGTPVYFGSQTSSLGPASFAALGPASSGESSFTYASSSGQTVSGNIGYQKAPSFGSYAGCAFFGTVISG